MPPEAPGSTHGRWPCSRSLSLHLLGVTAIVLALAGATVVGTIAAVLRWGPELAMDHMLEVNAGRVIDGLKFDADGKPFKVVINNRLEAAYEVLKKDCVYRVLDADGAVLLASDDAASPYTLPGAAFDPLQERLSLTLDGEKLQVITEAFEHAGRRMFVQVMRSDRLQRIALDNNTQRVRSLTIIAAIVGMALFSVVVVITLHQLLKPLRRAAAAASVIDTDNLSTRLSLQDVPRELAPLFNSVNLALDRLEKGYQQQREFLATAAHELKTPLALMRGQVELDASGERRMLLQDIDQMARQVHQLLHLAEASERNNYRMLDIDPYQALAQAGAQLERLAQRRRVRIVFMAAAANAPALIHADPGALSVLSKNLLENAIHHSPEGGAVTMHADEYGLSVRDEGLGIPPEAMPHLFERFWRGPHRRDDGAGLGLSICAEIARAHGWELRASNAHRGALFEVRFKPATAHAPQTPPPIRPSLPEGYQLP
ncbi:two-component sensor histidine kinase [Herbaspirillum sp. LeCh32-8]|uniref:sensor histidine kinase n=1 Tax=Herbaspirillum sp. LeCh32-8 TaxID=2821356 RepID=UPI001AE4D992|nr:ATP-binding protein [Herbaspirillum sp. LeCh32-8]MBP0599680.1 two-component sensor histidine kinase [Herbaspirillum sp. LeCh32-8]